MFIYFFIIYVLVTTSQHQHPRRDVENTGTINTMNTVCLNIPFGKLHFLNVTLQSSASSHLMFLQSSAPEQQTILQVLDFSQSTLLRDLFLLLLAGPEG